MNQKHSLAFRAQVIADTTKLFPGSHNHRRLVEIALRELTEAVDQALADYAEIMKK